jgi:diacylglycerol kinase family enzyme
MQPIKKRAGDWFFVWSGLRVFFREYDRRHPRIGVSWGARSDERRDGLFVAILQNTTPYTFFRSHAMRLCPDAELDGGLDLLALDTLKTRVAVRVVRSGFRSGRHIHRKHVLYVRDKQRFQVQCAEPLPAQVDGEFIGEHSRLSIEAVPEAIKVLY